MIHKALAHNRCTFFRRTNCPVLEQRAARWLDRQLVKVSLEMMTRFSDGDSAREGYTACLKGAFDE